MSRGSFSRRTVMCLMGFALIGVVGVSQTEAVADTPYMDKVEQAMQTVAPAQEGKLFGRTTDNQVAGYDGSAAGWGAPSASWLLQTPDCWGLDTCPASPPAFARLTETIRMDIAAADRVVDIATLEAFPDGAFKQAIVDGLKEAYAAGRNPVIRIMGGCYPGCSVMGPRPRAYLKSLLAEIGTPAGATPQIAIASFRFPNKGTFSRNNFFSWNHAKIIAVDGKTVIEGGHNLWAASYLQTNNPITDVSMRMEGSTTGSAHRFTNVIWNAACTVKNKWKTGFLYLTYAQSSGMTCPGSVNPASGVPGPGTTHVLAMGRQGLLYQMRGMSGASVGKTKSLGKAARSAATGPVDPALCRGIRLYRIDYTNDTSNPEVIKFDQNNPADVGIRALIASATSDVFISQQDLEGMCPSAPRFDRRLLDAIAGRLAAGVPVRIVISTPGAGFGGVQKYSNGKGPKVVAAAIFNRAWALSGNRDAARQMVCDKLKVATMRYGPTATWPNGGAHSAIGMHTKAYQVDGRAFYIGSQNAYPAWLAEYGVMVDDPVVGASYKAQYADPLWQWSQPTAVSSPDSLPCT